MCFQSLIPWNKLELLCPPNTCLPTITATLLGFIFSQPAKVSLHALVFLLSSPSSSHWTPHFTLSSFFCQPINFKSHMWPATEAKILWEERLEDAQNCYKTVLVNFSVCRYTHCDDTHRWFIPRTLFERIYIIFNDLSLIQYHSN